VAHRLTRARCLACGKERLEAVLGEGDLLDRVEGGDETIDKRGKPPRASTGECSPDAFATDVESTVVATRAPPWWAAQTVSPTRTSFAFLREEQHAAPTGRW
jgi:hypothetical protein